MDHVGFILPGPTTASKKCGNFNAMVQCVHFGTLLREGYKRPNGRITAIRPAPTMRQSLNYPVGPLDHDAAG